MNAAPKNIDGEYRQTVSGLFFCIGTNDVPLIGIHWPVKAQLAGESNLSPVAGKWAKGESIEVAMVRQVQHEYGLGQEMKITSLSHQKFYSIATMKQYHWLLVELLRPPGEVNPQVSDVASFGWYTRTQLQSAIDLMHREKQFMFKSVLKLAIAVEPALKPFRKQFG